MVRLFSLYGSLPMRQACLLWVGAIMLACPAPVQAAFPYYFNSSAVESRDIRPFNKWTGVVAREKSQAPLAAQPCDGEKKQSCRLQQWDQFLGGLRGESRRTQIEAVHREMNRATYIQDIMNWGMEDYWATPLEFFLKNGDCEDYAIAKFLSLRRLGFSNDELRIVVLHDHNMNIAHAVLVVSFDGDVLVLDNYLAKVVSHSVIRHYQAIYSINETAWWRHLPL